MRAIIKHPKIRKYLNNRGYYDPIKSEIIRDHNKKTMAFPSSGVTKQDRESAKLGDNTERNSEVLITNILLPEQPVKIIDSQA